MFGMIIMITVAIFAIIACVAVMGCCIVGMIHPEDTIKQHKIEMAVVCVVVAIIGVSFIIVL